MTRRCALFLTRLVTAVGLGLLCVVWADGASWASATTTPADTGRASVSSSWSAASSSATGSLSRSASSSGSTRLSASSAWPVASPLVFPVAEPAPTAEELRGKINDLLPVVLLGVAVLCCTSVATLLVLIGKR